MIGIDIANVNGELSIKISDNGQTPFDTINFEEGIGLENTRERLQQLFGKKHEFSVIPNNNAGVLVCFALPLQFTANGNSPHIDRG
jgi:LytS/YehU family sensor histidine kinase